MKPMKIVQKARDINRATTKEWIDEIFDDFIELKGDRFFADDAAIIGGIARLKEIPVTVIGMQKGHTLKENIERNFGQVHPEGYRKSLRLMKQAEKFNRPIITMINTAGAFCGKSAEDRGIGEAIAKNLQEMSHLTVPVIAILMGEGGSGGAIALAVANEVWMMEYAIYSILSPEGFASILWKDSSKAEQASELMKFTSKELFEEGIVDKIILEKNRSFKKIATELQTSLLASLKEWRTKSKEELVSQRLEKFRKY
ncbi:acetyl-CoA carboxylase carboxyl transferase subunit alpha [Granulicatella elegans]|uniref:acetyl-CoA carboxylase carboxyl transferase subunit alpha n=1 Tax=Granulicatella elegans TaxID=137732 RepID=UPI0028D52FE5|nr:acetyl-CoA carboxylase carboxyl transferase subunit alpha [Granulicatella elegans]